MGNYGVIFDMDGVLVDSYRAHYESWLGMAEAHGLAMTEEQFAATFGRTSKAIIRALWGEDITDAEIDLWDAEKEAAYRDLLAKDFPEMDGAGELLRQLHLAGFMMAIGSSGPPENVDVVLRCLPNAKVITTAVTGMDVTHGKPDPEVFLLAAEKLHIEPSRCAVIEDAPAGIEAARRAGMVAIALTGTAPPDKLATADLVADSLRQLNPKAIAELIDRVP